MCYIILIEILAKLIVNELRSDQEILLYYVVISYLNIYFQND
jgi:hypothetical protein